MAIRGVTPRPSDHRPDEPSRKKASSELKSLSKETAKVFEEKKDIQSYQSDKKHTVSEKGVGRDCSKVASEKMIRQNLK